MNFKDFKPVIRDSYRGLELGKAPLYNKEDLYGNPVTYYTDHLITLLDASIMNKNLHLLSIEQERYLKRFFEEADKVEPEEMSMDLRELDSFLGTFYDECKPHCYSVPYKPYRRKHHKK